MGREESSEAVILSVRRALGGLMGYLYRIGVNGSGRDVKGGFPVSWRQAASGVKWVWLSAYPVPISRMEEWEGFGGERGGRGDPAENREKSGSLKLEARIGEGILKREGDRRGQRSLVELSVAGA